MATGYIFPILNSDGTTTYNTTITDALPVNPDGPGIFSTWGYGGNGILGNGTTVDYSSPIQIGVLSTWKQLNRGVGVKTDGTLWTWGVNTNGELGNGNTINYSSPVQVGSSTNWSKLCDDGIGFAIKTDGTLWAWGLNNWGQLGNGTTVSYSSPIQIGSLTNWNKIAMYSTSAVAIKTDGTLWAWGSNANGQLGNGTTVYYSSPIQIGALTNWSQVSISIQTEAIKTDGTLWAWGYNGLGGLGNGTTVNYSSPIQIGALTNWSQVACGFTHFIATKTDGTLWASGQNQNGQLGGGGVNVNYSSPIQIGALTNWRKVKADTYNSFAIKTDGTLWSWGQNGTTSSLGIGDNTLRRSPVQVGTLTNWNNINAYGGTSVAIQAYNTLTQPILVDMEDMFVPKDQFLTAGLWGFGNSLTGELGTGSYTTYNDPTQTGLLTNWKQVSCGYRCTLAVKTDGTLWGYGSTRGDIGNGVYIFNSAYASPVQVGLLSNWKTVSYTASSALAIKTDGTLWAWGQNMSGNIGNGSPGSHYSSPVQIGSLTTWKYAFSGYNSSFAITTNGTLWGWGAGNRGQLGNGTQTSYSSPIQIGSDTTWRQISCGYTITTAVKTDGTLWTWGRNDYGQLGNGVTSDYSSPIQIGSLTNWKQVSCGSAYAGSYAAAIKTDGTLWAWGRNDFGQLGNGNIINYSSPIQIGSLTNWKQVSCGYKYVAAVKTDGTLWTWGKDYQGCLGRGVQNIHYSSPCQVGSLTSWKYISASNHSGDPVTHTQGILAPDYYYNQ